MGTETRNVDQIVFRKDLYPRINHDPALVQKYVGILEVLPPIEVNQSNELIDGWHRWTAHKTAKAKEIAVTVTKTASEAEFLALACRRNATAGKQLEERDKAKMAIRLYNGGEGVKAEEIAEILSVTVRTVNERYLADVNRQLKVQREERMLELHLSCHTQQQIADDVGVSQKEVSLFVQGLEESRSGGKFLKSAKHDDGFEPQVYSVWNFPKANNEVKHFGNIPPEIIDNLLYYYTKPFDVVFDPFAGGGSTIDVCRKRWRRYFASDLNPIEARKHEIRQHDITAGLPDALPVPQLVFLDPPYWKQAEGKYSKDATDLANIDLESFLDAIAKLAAALKRKWTGAKNGGKLALIIGPWKDNGQEVDLAFLCYQRIVKYLNPIKRVIVPYSTQVHGGAYVQAAKDKRELLYLFRDLMLFECK
jgi:ParB-like chromosome segregation protein Spo0J